MLDTLLEELDSYTDENFKASNFAVRAQVFLQLYYKGHINKETLFIQFDNIVHASVDRTNPEETRDKIKLDSLLYRIKEWLER